MPKEVGPDMKNLKSMSAVWTFLDKEYGSVLELTKELISLLVDFKYGERVKGSYQDYTGGGQVFTMTCKRWVS